MSPRDDLTVFEGHDVLDVKVAVTHVGDGLTDALAVEPNELRLGQRVMVLVEAVVTDVRFKPLSEGRPEDGLCRTHTLKAGTATWVADDDGMREMLADQRDRILRAREEAAGVQRLEDADGIDGAVQDLAGRRARRARKAEVVEADGVEVVDGEP
jgi:hypothetical protein